MQNQAFEPDPPSDDEAGDRHYLPSTSKSTMSGSQKLLQERLPINIRRPILYMENLYPVIQCTSSSSGACSPNGNRCTTVCINHGGSGASSPDFDHKTTPRFQKLSQSVMKLFPRSQQRQHYNINCSILPLLTNVFPILSWLPKYKVRSDLLPDLITGFTILALHIPQGLAYGRLAGVESINGLYVSLFPVVLYAIFGGSRQISVGTFAVICIACKDVLDGFDVQGLVIDGHHFNKTNVLNLQPATRVEILTSLCLLVGLIQFTLGFLRLGVLATLLSDPIISAFVVACSLHVFTSQVFALFGLSSAIVPEHEPGIPFDLIKAWLRLFRRLPRANIPTVIISTCTIATLVLCKNVLEPYLIRRFKLKSITIPIDIMAIAALTTISYCFDLNSRYNVSIIPKLSTGFEGMPVVPRADLWPKLFTSAVLIAFIAYTATYTLSKIYARKHGYEIYPNQELVALGVANIVSSFLLCFPSSGSLARSAVQEKVGSRTQLASLISSAMIVVFLLFLSHLLDSLPNCVLACIIVVALRSTMSQFTELFHYWKISKLDGLVWIGTFLLVVLFGVATGLLYGLMIGLAFLILRIAVPQFNLKYHVPGTECYLATAASSAGASPSQRNGSLEISPVPGVVIFEFLGPFIFLNVERFKKSFDETILRPIKCQQPDVIFNISCEKAKQNIITRNQAIQSIHSVVFDMARVSYVDSKAVDCLLELDGELRALGITLLLAGPNEQVVDCFVACKMFHKFDSKRCFLSTHDAVCASNEKMIVAEK